MSPCVTPLKIRKSALQSFLAGVLEGDPSPGKQNADLYRNHFLAFLCGLSPRYLAQNSVCSFGLGSFIESVETCSWVEWMPGGFWSHSLFPFIHCPQCSIA